MEKPTDAPSPTLDLSGLRMMETLQADSGRGYL
jgi:hypothetical protein